jgi:hypothetical protein
VERTTQDGNSENDCKSVRRKPSKTDSDEKREIFHCATTNRGKRTDAIIKLARAQHFEMTDDEIKRFLTELVEMGLATFTRRQIPTPAIDFRLGFNIVGFNG